METSNSAVLGNPLTTFYLAALDLLEANRLPFLVGGTFAYARYTGIDRETKDLDIFVRPERRPTNAGGIRGRRVPNRNFLSALAGQSLAGRTRPRRHL